MDESALTAAFDALNPQMLRARGSLKWTKNRRALGAGVAESDLGTAPAVTRVLEREIREGTLGYLPLGLPQEVAQATATFQHQQYDWQVEPEDVSLLPDVLSALYALIERHTRGGAVIVPTPAYMPFLTIPTMLGRKCVQVPALVEVDQAGAATWHLDLEGIESAMRAGAGLLVLCNPWNPVGRVLSAPELDAVAALSCRYGVTVFADEIHGPLVLEPGLAHTPYAARPGADPALTYTATSVSKGWNVAGLKCAQLIATGGARRHWESSAVSRQLSQHASVLGARATLAALSPQGIDWLETVCGYIHRNVEFFEQELSQVPGVVPAHLEGTYLYWLDLGGTRAAADPAGYLLRTAGLVVNEGAACGLGYESFCRVNLATGWAVAGEIAQRLRDSLS